jgi:hypothetical protein
MNERKFSLLEIRIKADCSWSVSARICSMSSRYLGLLREAVLEGLWKEQEAVAEDAS